MLGINNLPQVPQGPSIQGTSGAKLEPGALGSVGNLAFKGAPGATPRASSPGILERIGQALSDLAFRITASPDARAARSAERLQQEKTQALGDLLGHLTASTDNKSAPRSIASDLAHLAALTRGDISQLPGGIEGLKQHLQKLGEYDVMAAGFGVLGKPDGRDQILQHVAEPLRDDARTLLNHIASGLADRQAEMTQASHAAPDATLQALGQAARSDADVQFSLRMDGLTRTLAASPAHDGAAWDMAEAISRSQGQGSPETVLLRSLTGLSPERADAVLSLLPTSQLGSLRSAEQARPEQVPEAVTTKLSQHLQRRFAPLTAELQQPLRGTSQGGQPMTKTALLPVNGESKAFTVDELFYRDAVGRVGVSLSVSGQDASGQDVASHWQAPAAPEQRDERLGQALEALQRVAGSMAEPLTRMLNQDFGVGLVIGLTSMGQDSPFRLADGSAIIPGGDTTMDYHVHKQDDGTFRVDATTRFSLASATLLDADGEAMPVIMDPTTSFAALQTSVIVSPDGSVRQAGEPKASYNFTTISE